MSNAITFVFQDRTIGVLTRGPLGFVFHASDRRFDALDARSFATQWAVHQAARDIAAGSVKPAPKIARHIGSFRYAS